MINFWYLESCLWVKYDMIQNEKIKNDEHVFCVQFLSVILLY